MCTESLFWGLNRLVRARSLLVICLCFRIIPLEESVDIQGLTFECFFPFAEIFPRDVEKKKKVIRILTGERLLSFP